MFHFGHGAKYRSFRKKFSRYCFLKVNMDRKGADMLISKLVYMLFPYEGVYHILLAS